MKKIGENIIYKGKFISLKESEFINNNNIKIKWESIERVGVKNAVVVIAHLLKSDRYIFIKQFRQAVSNYCIGFPAGLAENDDLECQALKELKEETGYTGRVTSISPKLYINPALLSDTMQLVCVDVYEEEENITQDLEDAEEIEVFLIKKDNILAFLDDEREKGTCITSGVWYAVNNYFRHCKEK